MRITILTEASNQVGSGHFCESVAIADALSLRGGLSVEIVVNTDAPERLVARSAVTVRGSRSFAPDECRTLAAEAVALGTKAFVIDLRFATEPQLDAIASAGAPVVCIDETGRDLRCSALINSTWSRISMNGRAARRYEGPDYLPMAADYVTLHDRGHQHDAPLRSLAATFGGVDRSGTTLAVIRALSGWRPDITKRAVVGPACNALPEIQAWLQQVPDPSWVVLVTPPSLAPLLSVADVGLTAGGDTLWELACVGTPALVIYEDPHEGEAGRAFEGRGFGKCLCQAESLSADGLRKALLEFDNPVLRQRHADTGRTLVDGRGATRIAKIVEEILHDSPVPA